MIRAIVEHDRRIQQLIAVHHAALRRLAHALFDSWNIFSRNGAAFYLIYKDETFVFIRLDLQIHMTVLSTTAGLTDVFPFRLGRLGDRLAVGYLRRSRID